jgi:hypothetical protein
MAEIKPMTLGILGFLALWWWFRGGGGTPDYSQGIWSGEYNTSGMRAPGGPTKKEIATRVHTSPGPEVFMGATPKQVTAYTPPIKPPGWSDLDWYDFTHGY